MAVRRLLRWFGRDRRGRWVVEQIRAALADVGLGTVPDFDSVWIDESVKFYALDQIKSPMSGQESTQLPAALEPPAETPQAPFIGGAVPDPTHKVGKLEAASRGVVSVAPDDSVERAATLMMAKSYSQLPVMVGERDVKGMVTWESIARKLVLSGHCTLVRDCTEKHREISSDSSFSAIPKSSRVSMCLFALPTSGSPESLRPST